MIFHNFHTDPKKRADKLDNKGWRASKARKLLERRPVKSKTRFCPWCLPCCHGQRGQVGCERVTARVALVAKACPDVTVADVGG